jgi:toxin CcdB
MRQFDVHRAPGRPRADVPFVVVLQSRAFADHPRRLVAPHLATAGGVDAMFPRIAPRFTIDHQRVVLDVFQLQSVPRGVLGPPVASLADDDSALLIVDALDLLVSRAYG